MAQNARTKLTLRYENSRSATKSGRTETVEFEAESKDELVKLAAENVYTTCNHDWLSLDEMMESRMFQNWVADHTEETEL
jgi:hypothetical protein